MANLLKYSGGVLTQGNLPETWTAPTSLFGTQDREDTGAGTFASATSRWTAPASGLPDGYLLIGAFEYQDTSNGRFNPQARFAQITGTGNFVTGTSGGYSRDTSEDRSYVRTWAFWDGPSASGTIDFQWKADTDDATGGTERSELQVIPFFYSDIGLYTSTSASLYGGTTPNQVTGFTGTDGTNITIASDVVSVTGDNKKYLILGSQFFEGRGGRTQRWHGLDIDGVQEDAAKAYSYYRSTSDDESGDLFTWMVETSTATITIEQSCYRGDGVSNLQGGADVDGSTPGVGAHALVVIELNDAAEGFRSSDTNQSALLATTGPIDLDINEATAFNDTASFTDLAVSSINCVQTADYLFGANISAASNNVANTTRWTAYSEFTVNGTENPDSVAGDYLRNDQSTTSTFGWSANLLGFEALTAGDDVGVSVTELAGSEGGGAAVSPAGWSGFWGLNLDTLEAAASDTVVETTTDALVIAENTATLLLDVTIDTTTDALVLAEGVASIIAPSPPLGDYWATGYWHNDYWADNYWRITVDADTTVSTSTDALVLAENQAAVFLDVAISSVTDALVLTENQAEIVRDVAVTTVTDALVLSENQADIDYSVIVTSVTDALVLAENQASISIDATIETTTDPLVLSENQASIGVGVGIETTSDALVLAENQASVSFDISVEATADALTLSTNQALVSLGVTVEGITDSLVIAEGSASIVFDVVVETSTDALVLTENQASISEGSTISGVTDALTLTEGVASVSLDVDIDTTTDALILSEGQAAVSVGVAVNAVTDALTLSEGTASIELNVDVDTVTDTLVLNEGSAAIAVGFVVETFTDALVLSENQATVDINNDITVNCATDSMALLEGNSVIIFNQNRGIRGTFYETFGNTFR